MSKKNGSKKNWVLSNSTIVIAVIAIILVWFSDNIIRTILTVGICVAILYLIGKKIGKIKKM